MTLTRPIGASVAERVLAGDPRAIARAISLIEDDDVMGEEVVRAIFGHTGTAYVMGVTGPPGAGKSTLVDRLTAALRRNPANAPGASGVPAGPRAGELTVGVIAVDPTSPFTGGALLGDRLRMQGHAGDEGVFIRSMATRGHLGGLARATADTALVLDAAGKDVIIIETVGVGQDEVEIIRTADVSIVVLVPGAGDDVQALKAGIMEIADIFVVNKADREGADRLAAIIEAHVSLKMYGPEEWRPPIVKTIATSGQGIGELVDVIWRHRAHSETVRAERRRARSAHRLRELVSQRFLNHLERTVLAPGELQSLVDRIAAREIDPFTAAGELLMRALEQPRTR